MELQHGLCHLFGTEEYVRMRRELALLRDRLMDYSERDLHISFLSSGSIGEGVGYPSSDDDIMTHDLSCCVVKTYREAKQRGNLLMVSSAFSPGYCLLLDVMRSYDIAILHIINEMPFVSSSLWKQLFREEEMIMHGPSLAGRFGSYETDYTRCISCSFWPDQANDWINRNRSHGWPSSKMIQNILERCCHVVPVGDPDSPYGNHEWRISFSVAERILMHSLNHAQFLTYNLLRLCFKRLIENNLPGVLCSYFIKTTLFYTCENTSAQMWQENNIETCYRCCLSALYDYVDHIYCPNYFIPEYNMIKRKINRTNRHHLLDIIRYVHSIGILRVIHLSGESVCLDSRLSFSSIEWDQDIELLGSINVEFLTAAILKLFCKSTTGATESCTIPLRILFNLFELRSIFKQSSFIIQKGVFYCCQQMINILWSSRGMNKRDYSLYKTLEFLLRFGYKRDMTSGKLTFATYMYIVGKTECALSTIRRMLSDYPPYAIATIQNDIQGTTYIDFMCGRGHSIEYKTRYAWAPQYRIDMGFHDYHPFPLRIWIYTMKYISVDPILYAYVIECLCQIRRHNQKSLMQSMRTMVHHINDLKKHEDIANARMCIGIIKFMQGEDVSACKWLGSVYLEILHGIATSNYRVRYESAAFTYIACLLYKRFNAKDNTKFKHAKESVQTKLSEKMATSTKNILDIIGHHSSFVPRTYDT